MIKLAVKLTMTLGCVALTACTADGPAPGPTEVAFPGGAGSGQARFSRTPDGQPLLSWLESADDAVTLRYVVWSGQSWGEPVDIASSGNWFVNWADFPSVRPISDRFWLAHWLVRQPDSFGAYDAVVAVSNDGGLSFGAPQKLNDDATETEHGFVELYQDGDVGAAVWLDGRELANWSFDNPEQLLGVSLRSAHVDTSGRVYDRNVVDELVCDCCQPDIAIGADGPILVYRDRTEDELRDIVVRRATAAGWSEPTAVGDDNWFIEGCPVNGPAIAAFGSTAAVAWFTAADNQPRVRFARSDDGGLQFGSAVDLDGPGAYGQVGIVLEADGSAYVSWWRRGAAGGIDLVVGTVGANDELSEPVVVGHNDESQPIDVPQMIAFEDSLLLAWTTFADGGRIRVAQLPLVR